MAAKIAIGADHGGYGLKGKIIEFLEKSGYKAVDVGCHSGDPCDYPQFGIEAAEKVAERKASKGIVICKSGIGMSIAANKVPGVRAALCRDVKDAVSSRQHNDANVLVLSANSSRGKKALDIVEAWLKASFQKGRHARRVRKIKDYEKNHLK